MDVIFCKSLREARKYIGLTQKQIAEMLGVVESCYANWEQGSSIIISDEHFYFQCVDWIVKFIIPFKNTRLFPSDSD